MKDVRVLILGDKGQLGTELRRSFAECSMVGYDRDEVDVADSTSVRALIDRVQPNVILNASAYTAVDRAESEPDIAMAINGYAPGFLAEECLRKNALFVHYSTDYVFDGTKRSAWIEGDEPNPLNVYGRTKLEGERAVQRVGGKYLIFRTSWVYGPHGNNFMRTMLRIGQEKRLLKVVDDQIGAPTSSICLADATHAVVAQAFARWQPRLAGVYQMTCGGHTSWCGFARAILTRALGEDAPEVIGITSEEYPAVAQRPKNSVLSNAKLISKFWIALPDWSDALEDVLTRYRATMASAAAGGRK